MNVDIVTAIIHAGIQTILVTSLPIVGVGLAVGLVVAIIQAITQVQEQTLTFVPKMIVVLMMLAASFPWISRVVMDMALSLWKNIPFYSK